MINNINLPPTNVQGYLVDRKQGIDNLIVVLGNISKFNRTVIVKHYRVWNYAP